MSSNTILWDLECTNLNADFGYILCFGWKRLGEKSAHVISITDFPLFKKDPTNDKELVKKAAEILSNADLIVGHYSQRFDFPMLQSRLLYHGLKPIPPIPHVDTWRIARYEMHLHSNRLASVAAFLGLQEKTPLSGPIWIKASAGHKPSIKYVVEHCRQDVIVLEEAYMKIRCLSKTHPNVAIVDGKADSCPICGEHGKMQSRGWRIARTSKAQRFQCQKCGGWSSGKPIRVKAIEIR